MKNFTLGKLEIAIKEEAGVLKFTWQGVSENKDLIPFLEPFYTNVLATQTPKKVILDFRTLKSMNSSTVPAIIDWAKNYGENGVEVRICYNKVSNWQRTSFRLLATISNNLKNVSVESVED
ncbi:MAG: hypothetical protein H7A23_21775 [Leptospiraceae bacterium]|nr:hypothetical protein [Leptospiraceae bacterium]MCP5497191.1 hypothetical protein [Leptospiraceae bacterium]